MLAAISIALVSSAPLKHAYRYEASFLECCSCKDICVTEITGRDAGCHGFGAIKFKSGSFEGQSLSGSAAAFAWDSGKWVRLYIDAEPAKRRAVTTLMKAFLADWGKLEDVQSGTVRISSNNGSLVLLVDNGLTARLMMKPVLGANGAPVSHSNLASPIHSALMQGETIDASFSANHAFGLKGTNGFFNMGFTMRGRI